MNPVLLLQSPVKSRALTLLLPHHRTISLSPEAIETLLTQQAQHLEVSVAKLRAVYIRGVKEAVAQGYDGTPHTFGLARVQRFSKALLESNHRITQDFDLLPPTTTQTPETPNVSFEYSDDDFKYFQLVSAVLSGDISHALPYAEEIQFDAETKELIFTTADGSCRVNLASEEYTTFSK